MEKETLNQHQNQKIEQEQIKLPTTLEIAQKGVNSLKEFLEELPEKLREPLVEWDRYHRNILGIEPWISVARYKHFSEEEQKEIDRVISSNQNFLIVLEKQSKSIKKPRYIFNLLAIRNIMENYPQFFPIDATKDLKQWLIDWVQEKNPFNQNKLDNISDEQLVIRHYQQGLLSGYPIWTMSEYTQIGLSKQGRKTDLSSDKIQHLLSSRYGTDGGYVSYPKYRQFDNEYIAALDNIKLKSGLEKVIHPNEDQKI